MSYNLYVTRKEYWWDEESKKPENTIPKEKFVEFVEQHEKMELVKNETPSAHRIEAIFHPTGKGDIYDNLHITWRDGVIQSDMRIVPREVVQLLLEIADKTQAVVQGEDGETITEKDLDSTETMAELTEIQANQQKQHIEKAEESNHTKPPRRIQTRIIIAVIIVLFFAVGYIASTTSREKVKEPTIDPSPTTSSEIEEIKKDINQKIEELEN